MNDILKELDNAADECNMTINISRNLDIEVCCARCYMSQLCYDDTNYNTSIACKGLLRHHNGGMFGISIYFTPCDDFGPNKTLKRADLARRMITLANMIEVHS